MSSAGQIVLGPACPDDISGTVVDGTTSLGLENVTVFLFDSLFTSSIAQTTTDGSGEYIFMGIEQGAGFPTTYGVRALAPENYTPTQQNALIEIDCSNRPWIVQTLSFTTTVVPPLSSDALTAVIQTKYFGIN